MPQDPDKDMKKASIAATKIQANFRGYRVRKQLKESKRESDTVEGEREGEEEERSVPDRENGPRKSLEERSATKIQAGVRGFLVRKRQEAARAAATRIQAGFRGFRARKQLKQSDR